MMSSLGKNNSLQTAPLYPTALAGGEALLQNATSSAGENVLVPSVLQSAGPATGGILPELVALILQTVQVALAEEGVSSSAAPLPSSSAVIPTTATQPCSVGVPALLPSLASSAKSFLASGTGFNVQA